MKFRLVSQIGPKLQKVNMNELLLEPIRKPRQGFWNPKTLASFRIGSYRLREPSAV